MKTMWRLTSDSPAPACNTFRPMLDALEELEADLHQHGHKEITILSPQALELSQNRNTTQEA